MAGLKTALAAPTGDNPLAAIDRRSGKPKRVTGRIRKVVNLLLTGDVRTIKAAAARADCTPDYVSRAFRKPHVRAYIDERTRSMLREGQMVAASRMLELVQKGKSEHVAFDASRHVLAINGIAPPSDGRGAVNVNISNVQAGYIIDLSGPGGTPENNAVARQHDDKPAGKYTIDGNGRLIADDDPAPLEPWKITPVGRQLP